MTADDQMMQSLLASAAREEQKKQLVEAIGNETRQALRPVVKQLESLAARVAALEDVVSGLPKK